MKALRGKQKDSKQKVTWPPAALLLATFIYGHIHYYKHHTTLVKRLCCRKKSQWGSSIWAYTGNHSVGRREWKRIPQLCKDKQCGTKTGTVADGDCK